MSRRKKPTTAESPRPHVLLGRLAVELVPPGGYHGTVQAIANGIGSDGLRYNAYVTREGNDLYIVRDGRAARRVTLANLIAAVLCAEEEVPL
jgi:hypothetical protein